MPDIKNETPVVVCAADNRYAMPLAVMLRSMELNLAPGGNVDVWILDGGVSWWNKRRVERSLTAGRLHLRWCQVDASLLNGCPVFGHISLATYYRVLVPNILPKYITKVIYLDLDILILGNIHDLWRVGLGTEPVLAVREQDNCVLGVGLRCCRKLGLPEDAPYFNAGVLVMNLAVWRNDKISAQLITFLALHKDEIVWWDQDAMNALLYNRWAPLHPIWNIKRGPNERDGMPISGIIHYAGTHKPWHYGFARGDAAMYFNYLDQTCWKHWRPRRIRKKLNRHIVSAAIASIPFVGRMWSLSVRLVLKTGRNANN